MVDYSLQRRWTIALAIRAMRRMAADPNCAEIEKLRAAAALMLRLNFKSTSYD